MRILFLSHRVPYPPDKGDRIRSYNIIKGLARNHSISLMSVSHEPVAPKSYEALKQYCDSVDIVRINAKLSRLWSGLHLFTNSPLTLPAFYSRRFQRAVRDKLQSSAFDLIYIYSSSMAQYVLDGESGSRRLTHEAHEGHEGIGNVPAGPIPKVMDFIDVDSQKWFDYAATARQPMKAIYQREGIRLRAFEKQVAARCALNLFTTESELKIFQRFAPDAHVMALPIGVDLPSATSQTYRPNRLVFVGSMDYRPNIDAMVYFTDEILPLIEIEIPGVELFIVGRNPSSQIKALDRRKNVTVTGEVADVGSYLQDAAASVIPLRIARGIQTKLLEAMAHGVPVIATHAALDGIAAKPARDLLVADEFHDFAGKTIAVLQDRSMRAQLAANALALVQKDYRWETTLQKLEEAIASISLKSNNDQLLQAVQNLRELRVLRGKNLVSQAESSSTVADVRSESDGLNQTRTNEQLGQTAQNLRELRVLRGENLISQAESTSPDTDVRGVSDALNVLNQTPTNEQLGQTAQNLRELRVLRGKNLISQAEWTSPDADVRGESDGLNDLNVLNGLNQTRTVDKSFVSFVIPAKNEAQMIGQCLDAINNLAYDPARYECIVVDNGSVDDTAKIAKQKGAKVLTLADGTISALRNFGAKQAQGEYLAFIDADCAIDTQWLNQALRHFEDPSVGCAGSHPDIPEESTWVQRAWHLQNRSNGAAQEVDWLPSMNMLVKREAFLGCAGFNEALVTCEDVDFCYRLKPTYKIVSDSGVKSVHFGEAKTIAEFFHKERWRGQSNVQGVWSHGFYWQEVPSLALPIYYFIAVIFLPVTLVYLVGGSYLPLIISGVAVLLPTLLLAFRTSLRAGDFTGVVQLTFLYLVYSLARAAAIARLGAYRTSNRSNDCSKAKDVTI